MSTMSEDMILTDAPFEKISDDDIGLGIIGPGEIVRIAWDGMVRNKVRALLTMLGVIIGVAAVIIMIAISAGTEATIAEQIEGLGSNLVFIQASFGRGRPVGLAVVDRMLAPGVADDVPGRGELGPAIGIVVARIVVDLDLGAAHAEGALPAELDRALGRRLVADAQAVERAPGRHHRVCERAEAPPARGVAHLDDPDVVRRVGA